VDTYHSSVNATLIPKKLVNANPASRRWPAFENSLLQVDAALKFHFMEGWTSSLNYAFESLRKKDWQTETLNPFRPGVSASWLGNVPKNYDAHIVGVMLDYKFE
jgi:hypothetical protein